MGNGGSYTSKATINPNFYVFTKWGSQEMSEFLQRGQEELSETFALRRHEFDFLIGQELVDFPTARALFNDIFDTDRNGLVDKFEVMTVICLTSKLANKEKVHFFFDLFNFNKKGFLYESELTLLILATSRGVFKADQKYVPPTNKAIAMLVQEAKLNMKLDKSSIRKPELIKFCLGNRDVLSFLESWRGHASQVLLSENGQWRDPSFPAAAVSIAPHSEWLKIGMPPEEFVHWRRLDKIGNELGCLHLFTHDVSFLKTVDRRRVYQGDGVIGAGYFKQGMLADRWLLNALAAMIARPDTLLACIALTGQEKNGRYCCRFYEGGGWRSVNIDNRIPCAPDFNPLFASSSHSLEAWPLILQKGLSKYLGSYGHLARCGERGDATLTALRLLTGGHVQQFEVSDFHWSSANDDQLPLPQMQRGAVFVKRLLEEGSLISFGRSDPTALMSRKLPEATATIDDAMNDDVQKKTQHMIPPYGRLFPVLGSMYIRNFNYLILRDGYDIISDADPGVNFETGHSRTFMLKIEDIAFTYDTIAISRFPDSLRPLVDKLRLRPWFTEFAYQDTSGVHQPAAFALQLQPGDASTAIVTDPVRKMGDRLLNINAVLQQSDGKGPTEVDKLMTLKEKVDFSRVQLNKSAYEAAQKRPLKSATAAAAATNTSTLAADTGSNSSEQQQQQEQAPTVEEEGADEDPEDLIELCLTASSSCDWSFAGSAEAGAKLRLRISPSPETQQRWQRRELLLQRQQQRIDAENAARVAAAQRLLDELNADEDDHERSSSAAATVAVANTGVGNINASASASANLRQQRRTSASAKSETESTTRTAAKVDQQQQKNSADRFDIVVTASRSWLSHTVQLIPGRYFAFADVEFAVDYEHAFQMTLPADISDAPWLDGKSPDSNNNSNSSGSGNNNNRHIDRKKNFTRAMRSGDVQQAVASKSLISITDETATNDDDNAHRLQSNGAKATGGRRSSSGGDKRDLSQLPRVWLQVSSVDPCSLLATRLETVPAAVETSLAALPMPQPQRWPFSTESQAEASTRCLINALARAKEGAQLAGLEFMQLAAQYKEKHKTLLYG